MSIGLGERLEPKPRVQASYVCAQEEVVGMRRLVAKVHAKNALVGGGKKTQYYMRSLDLDRKVIAQVEASFYAAPKRSQIAPWLKRRKAMKMIG